METIQHFLMRHLVIDIDEAQEIAAYVEKVESEGEFYNWGSILTLAENWIMSPNEKASKELTRFYSEMFDLCRGKAKCLLVDLFQNDRALFPEDVTGFLYTQEVARKLRRGEIHFIEHPCNCKDCLIYS